MKRKKDMAGMKIHCNIRPKSPTTDLTGFGRKLLVGQVGEVRDKGRLGVVLFYDSWVRVGKSNNIVFAC